MADMQQNPDGSWSPAQPLDWQGGLDWEVRRDAVYGYRAELFDKEVLLAVVTSRWRPLLAVKMRLAAQKWRRR